jgi:putative transcriptional regulator
MSEAEGGLVELQINSAIKAQLATMPDADQRATEAAFHRLAEEFPNVPDLRKVKDSNLWKLNITPDLPGIRAFERAAMNRFSKELIESLTEACEHAEGKPDTVRVHVVEVPDVKAIRRRLHMSQQEFAQVYRIPLATLKNWEQGRRQPDAPAAAYLQVIAKCPREAREALAS